MKPCSPAPVWLPRARILAVCASLLWLNGCADRSGCPADLQQAGEDEARRGARPELPNARCELEAAERSDYFAGRALGLAWYCDGQRLFEEARLGRSPELKICPLDLHEEALAAQRTGEEIRKAQETAAREQQQQAELLGTNPQAASEAGLRARTAEAELEQLRALAVTRNWLANPAVSGGLPEPQSIPDSIRRPESPAEAPR